MAKKKRNQDLPEGMSRRQAKLAARAAEREALKKDPRPYGAYPFETDLIAMQEFIPAASAKVQVTGAEREVYLCTFLPGGNAAVVREEEIGGEAFVALQTHSHSQNPARDLAYALNWVLSAQPGDVLESSVADGSQPPLEEILPVDQPFELVEYQDFNWWLPESAQKDPQYAQALKMANDSVVPSHRVVAEVPGSVFWVHPGEKAHIRWVRGEKEDELLKALARVAARRELHLGEGSKFAGAFRTHDILVSVWDLDPKRELASYAADLEALNAKILEALATDAPLDEEERKQMDSIKSRQVTI